MSEVSHPMRCGNALWRRVGCMGIGLMPLGSRPMRGETGNDFRDVGSEVSSAVLNCGSGVYFDCVCGQVGDMGRHVAGG